MTIRLISFHQTLPLINKHFSLKTKFAKTTILTKHWTRHSPSLEQQSSIIKTQCNSQRLLIKIMESLSKIMVLTQRNSKLLKTKDNDQTKRYFEMQEILATTSRHPITKGQHLQGPSNHLKITLIRILLQIHEIEGSKKKCHRQINGLDQLNEVTQ